MKLIGPFAVGSQTAPQPSLRYVKIASLARAFGATIADDDLEQIDAFVDAIQEWQESVELDASDTGFLRSLGITPLA